MIYDAPASVVLDSQSKGRWFLGWNVSRNKIGLGALPLQTLGLLGSSQKLQNILHDLWVINTIDYTSELVSNSLTNTPLHTNDIL